MATLLEITEQSRAMANAPALATWRSDVRNEGWTVATETVSASLSVAGVFALIQKHAPCDLQMFGRVAVPSVPRNPDGHGERKGDCDAPYSTATLTEWQPQPDGTFAQDWLSTAPVRAVGRIDTRSLPIDETVAFDRVMAVNHGYRTGTVDFSEIGLIDNRDDFLDYSSTPRVTAQMALSVGADNIWDVTRVYPDDTFFETYAGRSARLAYLASGGDPYTQSDSFLGHEYYLDALTNVSSGRVRLGGVRIYCSYGWEFIRWPLLRGLLVGGSLWSIFDLDGTLDLSAWSETLHIGEVVRQRIVMDTIQGDITLKVKKAVGQLPISVSDFNNLSDKVTQLSSTVTNMQPDIATLKTQMAQAMNAQPPPTQPPPASSAVFKLTDLSTQGTVKGVYGADGGLIFGDSVNLPAYALFKATGNSDATWQASTADARALQTASLRIAACEYTFTSMTFDINLFDNLPHQVALYCLDWDNNGRVQQLQVLDVLTGAVLDTQVVSAFGSGKWLLWTIKGHVKIVVTNMAGGKTNAVVSGIMFR